jgi:hypothetical protein
MRKNLLLIILFNITLAAFAQVPSYVPTNGLVGWWPFNGNANDESGNGNNGNVNGAVLSNDRFGNPNTAYSFDGNGDYIDCGNSNGLKITGDITIAAWIHAKNLNGDHGIVSKMNTSNQPTYDLITSGNQIRWYTSNGSFLFSNVISSNMWVHVTATFDQQKQIKKMYVNGVFEVEISTNGSGIPTNNDNLFIGSHQPANMNSWSWNGYLDDICIWNRTLSASEIKNLFLNCSKSITQQPVNQGMFSGNALFTCASNDTLLTYQWQSNSGMGWNNLSNAGQYNGANTDSLIVNNVSSANNNQLFRCIIKGNCLTDTTQEATLRVWGLGINGVNLPEFKLYPNPSCNAVIIAYSQNPYSIAVYNSLGQMVLSQSALTNEHTFDISQWPKGVYYVELIDATTQSNKVQKLIRN